MPGWWGMLERSSDGVRQGLHLCTAPELLEKGKAVVFRVRHFRHEVTAFVLRFDGQVVGYLNRCVHVPVEMDWQPGEFLDSSKQFIICSVHGAAYSALSGQCIGGPCGQGRLTRIDVAELDGQVYWYPSEGISPIAM